MSTTQNPDPTDRREEGLDKLYELREELKTIADSEAEYARFAENALDTLREAGYDV